MGPVVLLVAAFLFIVDAAFLFGKADLKGTGVANVIMGGVMAVLGMQIGFTSGGQAFPMILSSLSLAFAFFYLILGWCLLAGYELKALGWYCLGAGLWTLLAAVFFFSLPPGAGGAILGVFGLTWSALFLAACHNLLTGNKITGAITRWILVVDSLITLMLPAYLLIIGRWPPF